MEIWSGWRGDIGVTAQAEGRRRRAVLPEVSTGRARYQRR